MERREAPGVCETPLAHLAIGTLAFRRSTAAFVGFGPRLPTRGIFPARLSELLANRRYRYRALPRVAGFFCVTILLVRPQASLVFFSFFAS
jgi:hypothetical protein